MKITADTNLLVRVLIEDDARQGRLAQEALAAAETVVMTLPALCEAVWVLSQGLKYARQDVAAALRGLTRATNVVVNRAAVEAGLAQLEAGGDFADGAIAQEGSFLGGETFLSFDRKAVSLLQAQGKPARLLA